MLIRFTVENFRSIHEEVVFSLLPGTMQKHQQHIIANANSQIDALRMAVIYGANASGKSNIVRAIGFARDFVVDGVRPKQRIGVEPFRLNHACLDQPSRFEFEFSFDEQTYAYGFVIDRRRVQEEWLYSVNAKNEHSLFERKTSEIDAVTAKFDRKIRGANVDQPFLKFVTRATRPNQLLLTKLAEDNVSFFEPIYEWFRSKLVVIFPESTANNIQLGVYQDQTFSQALTTFLQAMNTGIAEVCTKRVDPGSIDFPLDLIVSKLDAQAEDKAGTDKSEDEETFVLINSVDGRYLLQRDQAGSLEAYALGTKRHGDAGTVDFDLLEESDGTRRLFDLFPVLYSNTNRVFVIDELERSLHPNLVRRFVELFLQKENKAQLIVTTHESTLLDLNLLRRDEIWFVEKSSTGSSTLYSLEEFKPRHDLDIRKGYLQGRFGAIPVFGSILQKNGVEA
jgi:AAA15 family ATPase/GTPase